jgi:DNA polymerase-4
MESLLSHLSQKACKRLRKRIPLSVLYPHDSIRWLRHVHAFPHVLEPVHLDTDIVAIFLSLFASIATQAKVRLLGVGLSSLSHGAEQLDLFESARREKLDNLTKAADKLRDKFGFGSVQFGGSFRKDKPR